MDVPKSAENFRSHRNRVYKYPGIKEDVYVLSFKPDSTIMKLKLMKYAITGAEIVFCSKPTFKHEYRNVICMGNCAKKLAKENSYIHIPGCPQPRNKCFAVSDRELTTTKITKKHEESKNY